MVLADRSPHKVIVKSQIFKERGNKLTPNTHNCTYLDLNVNNCAYFYFPCTKKPPCWWLKVSFVTRFLDIELLIAPNDLRS